MQTAPSSKGGRLDNNVTKGLPARCLRACLPVFTVSNSAALWQPFFPSMDLHRQAPFPVKQCHNDIIESLNILYLHHFAPECYKVGLIFPPWQMIMA